MLLILCGYGLTYFHFFIFEFCFYQTTKIVVSDQKPYCLSSDMGLRSYCSLSLTNCDLFEF